VETQPIELPTSARTWKRGLVLVLFSCVATLGVFWLGLFERSTGSATRETQEPPAQHIDEDEGVEEEDATATAGSMPEGVAPEAAIEADSATPQEELTDAAPPRQRNRRPLLRAAADTTAVDPGTMTGSGALPEGTGADTERATRETQAGTDALLRGQLADAIRHLTAATRANPRHAPAYRSLGLARQRMGHDADAARAYRRYLALAPRAADAEIIRRRLSEIDR
jgi:tetratricopeptide (TPR) repeat protein